MAPSKKTEKKETIKVTDEQIQEWKRQHGGVYQLTTEDGKTCYIKDPIFSMLIMKLAFAAIVKSKFDFILAILVNCWLAGDEEIKNEEKYVNGLETQIDEICQWPDATVKRLPDRFVIMCEGVILETKVANREDINFARKRNAANAPFETNIHLLKRIALDEEQMSAIEQNPPIMFGMLAVVEQIKDKALVAVKKL